MLRVLDVDSVDFANLGFHFGNPNVEEPNLSRLWALKECCVFCSCIGLDFGPGKTLVILLNEKTKTPATSISLTCIGLIFRLGELSALYIYFGKFQKVLFLTFASCSPYFTQKLLEIVGSLGCSAPSLHQGGTFPLMVAWEFGKHQIDLPLVLCS